MARLSPRGRTIALIGAQLAVAGVLWSVDLRLSPAPVDVVAPSALVLAALFCVSGLLVFHFEYRDEAHTFTLSEIPIVIGLFLAGPGALVVGRVIGEVAQRAFLPRQRPLKIAFNLSNALIETLVALVVFRAVLDAGAMDRPGSWVAAIVAVVCADLVSGCTVGTVIRWHGGELRLRLMAIAMLGSAIANGTMGVVGALLLQVHTAATALLGVIVLTLYLAYRGYARLVERYASLQVLHEFTESIAGALVSSDIVDAMLRHAQKLLRAEVAELWVLGGDGEDDLRVRMVEENPTVPADIEPGVRAALLDLPAGRAVLQPRKGAVPPALGPVVAALDVEDFLAIPLDVDGTRCVFAVGDRMTDVSTFEDEDARLFLTLANHAAIALEKNKLFERVRVEARRREHQALHDDLTGLPNRTHFHAACAEALAEHGRICVLLMDLDLFKEVNDTLGHRTGDELLVEVGRRISASLPEGDLAARLGGDEFAVLLHDAGDPERARRAAADILDAVHEPVALHGVELDVRASVGAALAPEHGTDPQALLQRADVAMYVAKRGDEGVVVYSSDVDHHSPRRLQLAADLRKAIEDESLVTHFQPKADLVTGAIVGAEALLRWEHPVHGAVSPIEFVPTAEQTGLIAPMTMLVLRQSLSACARWRADGHDVAVAVNIAARSLLDPGFADAVEALLARSELPRGALTLEITESSIMSDSRRALEVLQRLADSGVRLSIDDFGTGYSSLSYLQRLPVHELKVDKSFVFKVAEDQGSRAIVRSIVDLGHSLGLSVVAEGVENRRAWDELVVLGCDIGQGYFLSRPIEAHVLGEWLSLRTLDHAPA